MAYKERKKSEKLHILESLDVRTTLSAEDHSYLLNHERGYGGEGYLDTLTEALTCECLVLNDLTLQEGSNYFQIDALIITPREVHLYEVKNYGGEYIYKEGFFQSVTSGKEFHSPIERLNRHTSFLQSTLESCQMKMPIKPFVAFVDPEFMLYQAPFSQKLLLRSTLPKHFKQLNANSGKLTKKHFSLASQLCELSSQTPPSLQGVPQYEYKDLQKGIICTNCRKFIQVISRKSKTCTCESCGHKESVYKTALRHIQEYKRLFPERKVTISNIYEWCGGVISLRRLRSVLQREYKAESGGKYVHYV